MIQKTELNKDQIKACSVPENQNSLKMSIVSQRGKKKKRERCLHWKTNPYQYFTNQLISLRHSMPFTLGIANCVQTKQRSKMYCLTQWQIVSAGSAVWKSLRSVAVRTIYNHLWWEKLTGILNSLRLIWHFHTIKSNNSFFFSTNGHVRSSFCLLSFFTRPSLDLFMSRRKAPQLTISLSSCEWKLLFGGDIYDPIQRPTSQTQEGRNWEVPYSIKRSVENSC